jgi:hypothetical protein
MAITLAQYKLSTLDDIQAGVIDEFRKSSYLLDNMDFDDVVTPGSSGSSLIYGYTRNITDSGAAFRAFNAEYTTSEAAKQRYTVELKVFGGSFQIDRVFAKNPGGLMSDLEYQLAQKTKSSTALWSDTVINGDTGTNANAFDGLNKALTGSSTEYNITTAIDLSTSTLVKSNADSFIDMMIEFLSGLDGVPTALLANRTLKNKILSVARYAGYKTQSEDAFGRTVDGWNGIPIIDLGEKPASSSPIIPITTNETSLYAARLGMDGFHGVTLSGDFINIYMPDLTAPGAVKTGEVEMIGSVALKATKAAGAFRKIKVS